MNWVLITGSSSGLGAECCRYLLESHFGVFATVRNRSHLPQWIIGLSPDLRQNLHVLELDMNQSEKFEVSIQEMKRVLEQRKGSLVGLVNNAGICITGPLELLKEEQLLEQMRVNWLGPILLTQKLLPLLRASQGKIINIGSAAGMIALPFLSAYSSSKFAIEAWSDSLRRELISQGVKVVLFQVGSIATPIWQKLEDNAIANLKGADATQTKIYEVGVKNFLHANGEEALKRKTHPKDVAGALKKVLAQANPPSRVKIGGDAILTSIVTKILPDKLLDFILCKGLGLWK